MAAGAMYFKADADVDNTETFDIDPGAGNEVVIHNITHSDTATLQFWDGTNSFDVEVAVGSGSWMGMYLHCKNIATDSGAFYRVVPTNNNTKICCDGVYTK